MRLLGITVRVLIISIWEIWVPRSSMEDLGVHRKDIKYLGEGIY